MEATGQRILSKMLDRLFAAIVNGPSLNCRPHHSRQRVDLMQLAKLGDASPAEALRLVLSDAAAATIGARIPAPPVRAAPWTGKPRSDDEPAPDEPPELAAARRAWADQQGLLTKLRTLVDEARTYENDTGVHVLNLGFPLLSLPPGVVAGKQQGSRRVLAPVAFIPVSLTVRAGVGGGAVEIACKADEVDRVAPNEALLAWLEQQTGKAAGELFADEDGASPWREIAGIVRHVSGVLGIQVPECFVGDEAPPTIELVAAPKSEELAGRAQVILSAVLGLFPMANQGLLRDTRELIQGDGAEEEGRGGPIESFLRVDASLAPEPRADEAPDPRPRVSRRAGGERLVAAADPCQARAVVLARSSTGLVIHGPPGTGKSQTITNIIGDHLARGERVLFVCDKRTALDVVANRLEHLGLGSLCAVVHDPQRDQRELYRSIREQLEALSDMKTHPKALGTVEGMDQELERLHTELSQVHQGVMAGPAGEPSLHELVGQWLALPVSEPGSIDPATLRDARLVDFDGALVGIREVLARALAAGYAANPWVAAAGLRLEELVSRPMDQFRGVMDGCVRAGEALDRTADPSIPPFLAKRPLDQQAAARARLAGLVERALEVADGAVRTLWATKDAEGVRRGRKALQDAGPSIELIRSQAPDAELLAVVRDAMPPAAEIARRLGALEAYLPSAGAWWGFLAFGRKPAAARVLLPLGLPVDAQGAKRGRGFYQWLRAVRVVEGLIAQFQGGGASAAIDAEGLGRAAASHEAVLAALAAAHDDELLRPMAGAITGAMRAGPGSAEASGLLKGLQQSGARAAALGAIEQTAGSSGLLNKDWCAERSALWRGGESAGPGMAALRERLGSLEDVLRVREGLARLPGALGPAARTLAGASAEVEDGLGTIRRGVVEAEVIRRLAASPEIRALDPRRMETLFERCAELEEKKRSKVADAIVHRWVERQRERLLASTGSRLNSAGADVRRRLTMRGRNAMRLRQVLALGRAAEGGDPVLDLRPVWMASPETVAQIFPRHAVFDVVVFDEASQCRLEEALPVLTRAKRVVIAGDPKQLPPTRFFESAVAQSDMEEPETDQQLFEVQQSEVEDLLGAALGLDVQQSYLDVHYRSRNSDLIAFSNDQFYSSRLQPIPGHPKNRARFAPLTLYRVQGLYDKRTNEPEAEQVCRIVRDLLKRAQPPSIGIGCFNLPQRDLISEKLEEMAAKDPWFAGALAATRTRRGPGAAEGLFVKNLENVQGDERDHIIISTTYGPDKSGRFYRRFGPLAMPGGGRRLNVLVTRAREEIHLVTSIPAEVYRALPPVPQGQSPGGGWLLFAYLQFAENLAARYESVRRALAGQESSGRADADAAEDEAEVRMVPAADVITNESRSPSVLAAAMGERLAAAHGLGSVVHWGNDGFCVDVAVRHPVRAEDVTVGVLCDLSRYALADDAVEWDLFRTAILRSQGWDLHRVWSPVLFRDARGGLEAVAQKAAAAARDGGDPDARRA